MISLLPSTIITELPPFVDGVILDSNEGGSSPAGFLSSLTMLSAGQMNKTHVLFSILRDGAKASKT